MLPFANGSEHGLAGIEDVAIRLQRDARYREALSLALADPAAINSQHLAGALAAYLRTLRAGGAAFDQYQSGTDPKALTESALRGFEVYRGSAGCANCHTIGPEGAMFTDHLFHNAGVGARELATSLPAAVIRAAEMTSTQVDSSVTSDRTLAALGRFLATKQPKDIGKYRTPSLRNVALTSPYMHDGSVATLREAIDHEIYYRGVEVGRPLVVTPSEREDLLAFLQALTSPCIAQQSCPGM